MLKKPYEQTVVLERIKRLPWLGRCSGAGVDPSIGRKLTRPPNRGRPALLQLSNQPTYATRSWAFASAAVAGCAGSWSTVAS